MGSSASKSETKVFTPKAPVDFSASFLSHLENSKESDYTRAQYAEKYIHERVASELKRLEGETITKFQNTTSDALTKVDNQKISVNSSNEKISKLKKLLRESEKSFQVQLNADIEATRQSVISCFMENQGKPLNCWEEVEQFKKLVHSI